MNYSFSSMTLAKVTFLAVSLSLVAGLGISEGLDKDVAVETKHVLENDTLLLVCNTTMLEGAENFFWIKNDTYGKGSILYSTGDWKVEFYAIKRAASGIYICQALDNSTGENVTLTATKVDVQYPAECEMSLAPSIITENETFSVSCSMHGNPEPQWAVFNNDTGVVIFEGSSSADMSMGVHVRCGYSGFWVCTGFNKLNHGINATRGFHLSVRCPPRPDPGSQITLNYRASTHNNVAMHMKIVGDPVPTYAWSRDDGKPFGDVIFDNGPRGTTLTIEDVDVGDFGNYTLKMNNSMGSYVAHYNLHAYGYPGKPYNLRASNVSHDSVDLAWTSGYDMGTTEHFMVARFIKNIYMTTHDSVDLAWTSGYDMGTTEHFMVARFIKNIYMTTRDSVALTWTSGYDMGTTEHFMVAKFVQNIYMTISGKIEGPYADGGVGQNWTYHLTGLDSDTEYTLAVLAENAQNWTFSDKISFNTSAIHPHRRLHDSSFSVGVIAGGVAGGVVFLAILIGLATLVYKRRNNHSLIKDKGPLISNSSNQYGGTYAVNKKTAI